jgi:hypothetical protein
MVPSLDAELGDGATCHVSWIGVRETGLKVPRGRGETASVQVSLAVSAWADLADRPASEVNGSKTRWAAIIAVNFVGPLSYFRWGRKR